MVDSKPAGDREKPWRESVAGPVPVQVPVGTDERLLQQILCVVARSGPPEKLQQRTLEPAHQLFETRRAAPLGSTCKLLIARRLGIAVWHANLLLWVAVAMRS